MTKPVPPNVFLGTGCIVHPKGWQPNDCGTCRYVMTGVAMFYRRREARSLAKLEATIYG